MQPDSVIARVLAQYNVNSLGALQASNNRPYAELFGGPTPPTIAPGASTELQFRVNAGEVFIAQRVFGECLLSAVLNTAIVGTPLVRDADPTAANNTHPNLGLVRLMFRTNTAQLMRHPIPASLLLGSASRQLFAEVPWVFTPNQDVYCTVYNDSTTATIRPWISLGGMVYQV